MARFKKYGMYLVLAGMSVTGVYFYDNPVSAVIRAEDVAELYEREAESSVVTALTGTESPDFTAYNGGRSNIVGPAISYTDIDNLCCRIRDSYQRSGPILWVMSPVTNGQALASIPGTYTVTNTAYSPPYMDPVTNATYTYSQAARDDIICSSTRAKQADSLFEYRDNVEGAPLAPTNLPVSYPLWGRTAGSVRSVLKGSAWPFSRTYTFPWEQWLDVNRARIVGKASASANLSFTNVVFITSNSPAVSISMGTSNTAAGYALCTLTSAGESVQFIALKTPPANSPLYVTYPNSDYKLLSYLNHAIQFTVLKRGIAIGYDGFARVLGYPRYMYPIYNADDRYGVTLTYNGQLPGLSVIECWSANTNVPPIYFAIETTGLAKTNAYFDFSTLTMPYNAIAVSNKVFPASQHINNDVRINTNKLYSLRQALTNLTRTVYVGATVTATQTLQAVSSTSEGYGMEVYADPTQAEWRDNGSGYSPAYVPYDMDAIISANNTRTYTTNTVDALPLTTLTEFEQYLSETLSADVFISFGEPAWESMVDIYGKSKVTLNQAKGCTVNYPSLWAITNGYVKNVKVFALLKARTQYESTGSTIYPQVSSSDYSDNYDIGGSFWYGGNLGVSAAGLDLNIPASVDTSITRYRFPEFNEDGPGGFMDTAKLSLIYEADNPTAPIMFDIPEYAFTQAYPSRYTHIYEATGGPAGLRAEETRNNYFLLYSIEVLKWVVYVEWDFKHLN